MKGKNSGIGIGVGGVSILAVFVVLCLTTLATLSYATARADYRLTEKNAQAQECYYNADAAAERKVAEVIRLTEGNGDWQNALDEAGYFLEEGAVVAFSQPVDSTRSIEAQIGLELDESGIPTGKWERLRWQTEIQPEPESSETLNLLK